MLCEPLLQSNSFHPEILGCADFLKASYCSKSENTHVKISPLVSRYSVAAEMKCDLQHQIRSNPVNLMPYRLP